MMGKCTVLGLGLLFGLNAMAAESALPSAIKEIFTTVRSLKNGEQKACATCHNPNSDDGSSEFDDILNVQELKDKGIIQGGDPKQSKLYRALTREKRSMPLGGEKLSPQELTLIEHWLEAGAQPTSEPAAEFISDQQVLKTILRDVSRFNDRNRNFKRYFTLVYLYNAGLSQEVATGQKALAKLLNSLSWHRQIKNPVPIDKTGAILRIDLRDYRWTEEIWKKILDANPYKVEIDAALGDSLEQATGVRQPNVRVDWFVHAASRPPLYHDVLGIPRTDKELESFLGVDVTRDINEETVIRSGFRDSGVSLNNRMIERHESNYGAYWKSYDFATNENKQNLFAHPLDFEKSGGEIIFNLPNGLQGYMLINAKGDRLDEGPIAIVQDKKRARGGFSVLNGVSCMRCHATGMIRHDDQVRPRTLANRLAFPDADFNHILALYPEPPKLTAAFAEDEARFKHAIEKTGNAVEDDTVFPLADRFENNLDFNIVAAELGVPKNELLTDLKSNPQLNLQLGFDEQGNGSIARDAFLALYPKAIGELRIGTGSQTPVVGGDTTLLSAGRYDCGEFQRVITPLNSSSRHFQYREDAKGNVCEYACSGNECSTTGHSNFCTSETITSTTSYIDHLSSGAVECRTPDGLIWGPVARTSDGKVAQMSFQQALDYCKGIGQDLPTEGQFGSLASHLGHDVRDDHYVPAAVADLAGNLFWTSTTYGYGLRGEPDFYARVFEGDSGRTSYDEKSAKHVVRCIARGESPSGGGIRNPSDPVPTLNKLPAGNYVFDGLVWSPVARDEKGNIKEFQPAEAAEYCRGLGMTLPTYDQFQSLARHLGAPGNYNPAQMPDMYFDTRYGADARKLLWSSSRSIVLSETSSQIKLGESGIFPIYFDRTDASFGAGGSTNTAAVRCVGKAP